MVAERKEGRNMEQCCLLGGEALKQNFCNGKRGRRGCIAVFLYLLKVVVQSLKRKSVFQEFNQPTSSMEGVQAGL